MTQDFNIDLFEEDAKQNGIRYWVAHEFMQRLGYETWGAFSKVINKAMASCAELDVAIDESFIPLPYLDESGKEVKSYKLTRFACFLITMHADSKKPQVAKAKVALAAFADMAIDFEELDIQRIEARAELKVGENIMSGVACDHGVDPKQLGIFKDAGFRGMYNMSLQELKAYKGMPNSQKKNTVLYDYMNVTELAANSFRATQTAERIKSQNARGLNQATQIAKSVASDVRTMMMQNSGIKPEDIPLEEDINQVKKELRKTNRDMKKIDKIKK
ncbi:BRO family protein [Wohlfahrtiimonas larvae]|nr:BRO family protein [Wohlfahrtiimonas larvae]